MVPLPSPVGSSRGLTRGSDGVFYVAQTPANQVARFTAAGPPLPPLSSGAAAFDQPTSAVATTGGAVFVYEPNSGQLQISAPDGRLVFTLPAPRVDTVEAGRLAPLPDGRVLLADAPGHQVIVYTSTGRLLGYFPVAGVPQGLAVTPGGMVAVADVQSKRVRLYVLAW
jgi:sugar lactone lactonase YvrE